jgi:hypothetical protein
MFLNSIPWSVVRAFQNTTSWRSRTNWCTCWWGATNVLQKIYTVAGVITKIARGIVARMSKLNRSMWYWTAHKHSTLATTQNTRACTLYPEVVKYSASWKSNHIINVFFWFQLFTYSAFRVNMGEDALIEFRRKLLPLGLMVRELGDMLLGIGTPSSGGELPNFSSPLDEPERKSVCWDPAEKGQNTSCQQWFY